MISVTGFLKIAVKGSKWVWLARLAKFSIWLPILGKTQPLIALY